MKQHAAMGVRTIRLCALALASFALASSTSAGPSGEQVVAGEVSIAREGAQTTIRAGDQSVIHFQSFDIGNGESVQFIQPDSRARVLNEILGSEPTRIEGSLLANGQVFLVNPSGIIFGRSATVNVGGLIAAAGNISTDDFLARRDIFTSLSGAVENHGTIEASAIALIGQQVLNTGTLSAPDGWVTLVAGGDVYLGRAGSNVVVKLEGSGRGLLVVDPGVENRGAIVADQVDLVVSDMHMLSMDAGASVQARDIEITAQGSSKVALSGTLDASASGAGDVGGRIAVRGDEIQLRGATLDASGAAGGGSITVGGESRGAGASNATNVFVDSSSTLRADAFAQGNGGEVVAFASGQTIVNGQLSARGGAQGGDGGFVETSGAFLDVTRVPDVSAPLGSPGMWLLDPTNIIIANVSDPNEVSEQNGVFRPSVEDSVLSVDLINDALAAGVVVIIDTRGPGNQAGNILQQSDALIQFRPISDVVSGSLSLQAPSTGSIVLNGGILAGGTPLTVTLGGGSVMLNSSVRTGGGFFGVSTTSLSSTALGSIDAGRVQLNAAQIALGALVSGVDITFDSPQITLTEDVVATQSLTFSGDVLQLGRNVDLSAGTVLALEVDNAFLIGDGGVNSFSAPALELATLASASGVASPDVLINAADLGTGGIDIGGALVIQVGRNGLGSPRSVTLGGSVGAASIQITGTGFAVPSDPVRFLALSSLSSRSGDLLISDFDSISLAGFVSAAGSLTIQNSSEVSLDRGLDLQAIGGDLRIADGIGRITLAGLSSELLASRFLSRFQAAGNIALAPLRLGSRPPIGGGSLPVPVAHDVTISAGSVVNLAGVDLRPEDSPDPSPAPRGRLSVDFDMLDGGLQSRVDGDLIAEEISIRSSAGPGSISLADGTDLLATNGSIAFEQGIGQILLEGASGLQGFSASGGVSLGQLFGRTGGGASIASGGDVLLSGGVDVLGDLAIDVGGLSSSARLDARALLSAQNIAIRGNGVLDLQRLSAALFLELSGQRVLLRDDAAAAGLLSVSGRLELDSGVDLTSNLIEVGETLLVGGGINRFLASRTELGSLQDPGGPGLVVFRGEDVAVDTIDLTGNLQLQVAGGRISGVRISAENIDIVSRLQNQAPQGFIEIFAPLRTLGGNITIRGFESVSLAFDLDAFADLQVRDTRLFQLGGGELRAGRDLEIVNNVGEIQLLLGTSPRLSSSAGDVSLAPITGETDLAIESGGSVNLAGVNITGDLSVSLTGMGSGQLIADDLSARSISLASAGAIDLDLGALTTPGPIQLSAQVLRLREDITTSGSLLLSGGRLELGANTDLSAGAEIGLNFSDGVVLGEAGTNRFSATLIGLTSLRGTSAATSALFQSATLNAGSIDIAGSVQLLSVNTLTRLAAPISAGAIDIASQTLIQGLGSVEVLGPLTARSGDVTIRGFNTVNLAADVQSSGGIEIRDVASLQLADLVDLRAGGDLRIVDNVGILSLGLNGQNVFSAEGDVSLASIDGGAGLAISSGGNLNFADARGLGTLSLRSGGSVLFDEVVLRSTFDPSAAFSAEIDVDSDGAERLEFAGITAGSVSILGHGEDDSVRSSLGVQTHSLTVDSVEALTIDADAVLRSFGDLSLGSTRVVALGTNSVISALGLGGLQAGRVGRIELTGTGGTNQIAVPVGAAILAPIFDSGGTNSLLINARSVALPSADVGGSLIIRGVGPLQPNDIPPFPGLLDLAGNLRAGGDLMLLSDVVLSGVGSQSLTSSNGALVLGGDLLKMGNGDVSLQGLLMEFAPSSIDESLPVVRGDPTAPTVAGVFAGQPIGGSTQSIQVQGGSLLLNTDAVRGASLLPSILAGGNLVISSNAQITTGRMERLAVNGNLTLTGASVSIGDIAALGDLRIDSPRITLFNTSSNAGFGVNGDVGPLGVNLLARSISVSSMPVTDALTLGDFPVGATPAGLGGFVGPLSPTFAAILVGDPMAASIATAPFTPFSPTRPEDAQQIAQETAGLVAEVVAEVTSAGVDALPSADSAIVLERPITVDETLEWLECVLNEDCDPDEQGFDDPRLKSDEKRKLRDMYKDVFGDEKRISGMRALQEMLDAYRARPDAPDQVDGSAFRRFLFDNPEESSLALRYLGELVELVEQWRKAQLGSDDVELGLACMLDARLELKGLLAPELYEVLANAPLQGELRCKASRASADVAGEGR